MPHSENKEENIQKESLSEKLRERKKFRKNRERYDDSINWKKHPLQYFTQVIWHRSWAFILMGLILAGVLSFLTYQSIHTERYDMRFVMAYYDTPIYTPYVVTLEGEFQTVYPDINGDGETLIGADLLNLGDSASVDVNEAYWTKFLASFSDDTYVMYILDEKLMKMYSGTETEEGESPFDSTCIRLFTGEDSLYLNLSDSPYFADEYYGENSLYIAFRRKPSDVKADDEIYYRDYLKLLELLFPEEGDADADNLAG